MNLLYRILRPLDRIFISLYRPKMVGLQNIPNDKACILAGNHMAKLDPLLLMACTRRSISYMGKIELFKGVKKYFFTSLGVIPVDRSKKNPEAMKAAVDCLNDGGVVGIFPEGTINRTKEIIMPFKYGAVKMAKETNTLIVPFAINGEYKFLRKSVVIEFGKPYKVNDGVEIENKRLEDKVIKLLKEKRNGRT